MDGCSSNNSVKVQGVEEITPDDVIIANGVSGALELALTSILNEHDGSILLVPRPGFPLYQVIAESHGACVEYYDLLPQRGWECDLESMELLLALHRDDDGDDDVDDDVDDKDVNGGGNKSRRRMRNRRNPTLRENKKVIWGILVNNPSNPTGAVYSLEHLCHIVALAAKYQVPIIADEIYGDLTFGTRVFYPLADVAASMGYEVPIITASGLGKQCEFFLCLTFMLHRIYDIACSNLRDYRNAISIICQYTRRRSISLSLWSR